MTDYLDYWGLSKPAFRDLNLETGLFVPRQAGSMISRLRMFGEQEGHFIVVTTPCGHGKTTLAKWLYYNLPPKDYEAILISLFKLETNPGWLFPKMATFLMGNDGGDDPIQLVAEGIDEVNAEGRHLVLMIDEAHKLKTAQSLAELHSLISMQETAGVGINIYLFGNEELLDTLRANPALYNRMTFQAAFQPLSLEETRSYLDFRLAAEGLNSNVISRDAAEAIYEISQGIFSVINSLGENSLVEAALQGKRRVDRKVVEDCAKYIPHTSTGIMHTQSNVTLMPHVNTLRTVNDESSLPRVPPEPPPNADQPKVANSKNKEQDKAQKRKKEDTPPSIKLSSLFYKNKAN